MAGTTVFFGTNRAITAEDPPVFANAHSFGKPYHFRIGEALVEKVGDSWRDTDKAFRLRSARLYPEAEMDDPAKIVAGSRTLFDKLRSTVHDEPRDVIVFIHGFANTFDSAIERAAELSVQYLSPATDQKTGDLMSRGRQPLVFAFSWPSDGVTVGTAIDGQGERSWAYSSDREDARASGLAMARCMLKMIQYLSEVAARDRCAQRIHLVAHSMGNWALSHALQGVLELSDEYQTPLVRLFDNVFLMAADIGNLALEDERQLKPLYRLARHIHVYHARNDSALSLSEVKPGQGARMGHDGPANMGALDDRTTAIDCANVSWTPATAHVRHQYYRIAPEVVRDVRAVLSGQAPGEIAGRQEAGYGRFRLKLDTAARDKLRGRRR